MTMTTARTSRKVQGYVKVAGRLAALAVKLHVQREAFEARMKPGDDRAEALALSLKARRAALTGAQRTEVLRQCEALGLPDSVRP